MPANRVNATLNEAQIAELQSALGSIFIKHPKPTSTTPTNPANPRDDFNAPAWEPIPDSLRSQ
jgi:hypothetical protein